jgi:hypothetical protein
MTNRDWKRYFEANASRPFPRVDGGRGVPDAARAAVAAALARFQAGETGEGRIAHEIYRFDAPGVDDDYRCALALFVREEGRHARILGQLARALGGRSLGTTRGQATFTRVRRLAGVRTKLLALLVAEVVGIGFYGMLASRLGDGSVRDALREICADEEAHLRFHADFFRAQSADARGRWLFRLAWWPLAAGTCTLLIAVERDALRAIGVSKLEMARRYLGLVREVAGRVTSEPEPAPQAAGALAGDFDLVPGVGDREVAAGLLVH